MNKAEKVVWTEGMFLRPHHFQRAESYLQTQIREWGGLQRSWLWGFLEIELDDAMLRQGCIALSYASGLLPDGTFFQFRDARQGPARCKSRITSRAKSRIGLAGTPRRSGRGYLQRGKRLAGAIYRV